MSASFDCCGVGRTPRETKIFYICLGVTGAVIGGLVIAVAVLATGYESKAITSDAEGTNQCASTPECSFQAAQMILNINASVDPCDDFYKFACGRKIDNAIVDGLYDQPHVQQQLLVFKRIRGLLTQTYEKTDARQKPAKVYAACMNNDYKSTSNALKSFVTELGGWPIAEGSAAPYAPVQKRLPFFKKARTYTTEGALFTVSVAPKMTDTSRLLVTIAPTKPYPFPSLSDTIRLIHLVNLESDDDIASRDNNDMRQLYNTIQQALQIPRNGTDDLQTEVSINYLTDSIFANQINWVDLLNSIFDGIKQFKSTDKVLITLPEYFKAIASYLSTDFDEKKERSIVNLEILHILEMMKGSGVIAGSINSIKKSSLSKLTNSNLQSILTRPWANCVNTATDWLSYIIAPEYAKHYPDATTGLESVKVMTTHILEAFRDRIKEMSWLDDETRTAILTKINAIKQNYIYPEWAHDAAQVDNYYHAFVAGDSHVTNYVTFSKFATRKNYLQLTQDGLRFPTWLMNPLTVNAFYHPTQNSMNILEAIMQPPTFSLDRLNVMNYGSLGMILAHEIAHSLDERGSRFDGEGNVKLDAIWKNESTGHEADKRFECFKVQYSKYQLTEDDLPGFKGTLKPISGTLGINENLADNGGIRNAYRAYKNWEQDNGAEVIPDVLKQYTHDQLFFISFANEWCTAYRYGLTDVELLMLTDEHSPARFRVIGSLSNFEEFGKAFKCPADSPMAPKERCELW